MKIAFLFRIESFLKRMTLLHVLEGEKSIDIILVKT